MKTDVAIHVATATDLDSLVRLAVGFRDHLGQSAPSEDELRASFALLLDDPNTEFFLVSTANAGGVGYAQCRYRYSAWVSGLEAELDDVFVVRECRRQGVGRRLVEFALARAKSKGCRSLGLNTNERNSEAVALYQGLGLIAERVRWQGGRQLWLQRPLDD
jgi:ribosomal protein S18 acetylase RimI-like enzyme